MRLGSQPVVLAPGHRCPIVIQLVAVFAVRNAARILFSREAPFSGRRLVICSRLDACPVDLCSGQVGKMAGCMRYQVLFRELNLLAIAMEFCRVRPAGSEKLGETFVAWNMDGFIAKVQLCFFDPVRHVVNYCWKFR